MANATVNGNALLGVGIDLGTTNSVLSILNQKGNGDLVSKVVDIPRAEDAYNAGSKLKLSQVKKPTMPSCVYYPMEDNYRPIVGNYARRQYAMRPTLVAKSIKSQMGEAVAHGFAEEVPDKTPAEIASRILADMLRKTEKIYRTHIDDAVITVPANFNAAMCEATIKAAQLAGIRTVNPDGSEHKILLSEPQAVIYDLINQINNGEVPSTVIDLSTAKNVMVFDLGGGTLDITLHNIRYSDETRTTVKIEDIATNRYTLLGGDNFDAELAEAMFQRFLKKHEKHGSRVVESLKKDKSMVMPQFLNYAEDLKLELSSRMDINATRDDIEDLWEDEDDSSNDEIFDIGGHLNNGYNYDDTFTKADIEAILEKFMGRNLTVDSYHHLEAVKDYNNIIYPILDVLKKASIKLATDNVEVDEIVFNGGMSRFYMVYDRIKEFFGIDPILLNDPDQSVARGAAVYHYYLKQKGESLADSMRSIGDDAAQKLNAPKTDIPKFVASVSPKTHYGIEWGQSILNDALYLGLQNGAKEKELISTGQELPYESETMHGFKIDAGINRVSLPIRSKNIDGSIHTIARGNICLKRVYNFDTYVSFVVYMSTSKLLTMRAWICEDVLGTKVLETATVELAIGRTKDENASKVKLAAPLGSQLNALNEIRNLLQLCEPTNRRGSNPYCPDKATTKKIKSVLEQIYMCSNKNDFAELILLELGKNHYPNTLMRLFTLARKIGNDWTEVQKTKLAKLCMDQLSLELMGMPCQGARVSMNIQAINTLAMCGSREQLEKLIVIKNPKYYQAQIYASGKSSTNLEWLAGEVLHDAEKACEGRTNNIQNSAYFIGTALRKGVYKKDSFAQADKLVKALGETLGSYCLKDSDWAPVILAMGWIAEPRNGRSLISYATLSEALEVLRHAGSYSSSITALLDRSRTIALKLMEGSILTAEEEEYLLKFAEGYEA